MRLKQCARDPHLASHDSSLELRRGRERAENTSFDMEFSRILKKQGSMDEDYKSVLLGLLAVDDKSEVHKKRKREDDGCDVDEESDPAYALVLRHLKEDGKSYALESDNNGLPLAIKYEGVEELIQIDIQNRRKLKKVGGYANVVKGDHESFKRDVVQFEKEHSNHCPSPWNDRLVKYPSEYRAQARISEKNKVQMLENEQLYYRMVPGNKNKIHYVRKRTRVVKQMNLVKKEKQPDRINVIKRNNPYLYQKSCLRRKRVKEGLLEHANKAEPGQMEDRLHHKCIQENNRLIECRSERVAQAQPVKVFKEQIGGKFMGMVKEEYEVKKENEKIYQAQLGKKHAVRGQTELMKVVRGDIGISSKKTTFGNCAVKKEPGHCEKPRLPVKGIQSQIRNVKCAKCSIAHKKSDKKYLEGEGNSKIAPAEVEILDRAMVVKKGIFSHFVSSSKFNISMFDEESRHLRLPSASDVFRKEVLKVLRKPFDKEELKKCREVIRRGSYLDHYPGVQRKLTKYRYKREQCLIVLRGFFFWLQNLTREGVFRPWEDKECLAVELLPSR